MGDSDREKMMKTICVLFVIAAVACAMPTEKDVKELGESRDSGVKQLADSDAGEAGNVLANGHYKIKGGNGKWCRSVWSGASNNARCDNSGAIGHKSKWALYNNGGKIVLRSHRNPHKRCEDKGNSWRCNQKTHAGSTEKFEIASVGNNQYTLKGGKDGKYCTATSSAIKCNSDTVGNNEKFTITTCVACTTNSCSCQAYLGPARVTCTGSTATAS